MAGVATPDGFKSLPYDHMTSVKLAINGVKKQRAMAPRSGAVKIDLTCADKSIRRPGSAPDLAGGEEGAGPQCHASPGANSLRSAKSIHKCIFLPFYVLLKDSKKHPSS